MITFNFWRNLQNPYEDHPLFRFVYSGRYSRYLFKPPVALLAWPTLGFEGIFGKIFAGMTIVMFLCAGGWLVIVPLIVILPVMMFIAGMLNGLVVAMGVSGIIARERQHGREHILAVTPLGIIGVNWAICTAVYHRSNLLGRFRFTIGSIYQAVYVGVLSFSILLAGHWYTRIYVGALAESAQSNFINSLVLFVIVMAFHFDYIQSISAGSLIGMIVPTFTNTQSDARVLALGAFLAVQTIMYATILIVSFMVLPTLFNYFLLDSVLLISVCRLITFVGIRELLLVVLWRLLARRLDVDYGEMSSAMRFA